MTLTTVKFGVNPAVLAANDPRTLGAATPWFKPPGIVDKGRPEVVATSYPFARLREVVHEVRVHALYGGIPVAPVHGLREPGDELTRRRLSHKASLALDGLRQAQATWTLSRRLRRPAPALRRRASPASGAPRGARPKRRREWPPARVPGATRPARRDRSPPGPGRRRQPSAIGWRQPVSDVRQEPADDADQR